MLFFGETDMWGGKGRQGEREAESSGGKKREMLCNHMNFVLPLTNTHTHIHTHVHTAQPTSRLCVSFGLEVCGIKGGQHILFSPA